MDSIEELFDAANKAIDNMRPTEPGREKQSYPN